MTDYPENRPCLYPDGRPATAEELATMVDTAAANAAEDGGDFSDLDDSTPYWSGPEH
ncbi:hypothetical protein [Streptomyces pini]|uniref:Uncharacterized protein n=1 Tax=Streptomyces pini TaxID=1520580 RepID=A0A1I4MEX9_9ACTN|nr:hypothetical protein [Streptomyces pini]SFM01613.1 hypothetical protein SAMN05192584_1408 [Streptomyces pini]